MKITLTGKPVSVNDLYSGRVYLSKEGRTTKNRYYWEAKTQYKGKPLTGAVTLLMYVYFPSKARSDLDNVCKATLDSLNGVIWKDDRQIQELHVYKHEDKSNPRVELEIET